MAGVFYQKLNLDTEKVIQEGFKEFEEEFITQGWSERSLRRAERRKKQGKGDPELYSYTMRDVTFLDDGSIIGTMEQYYVQVRSNSDGRVDQSSNMYYYYYNDIIAFKVGEDGGFDWHKKIKKYQVSTNDGGYYSSYERFIDDGKMYMIFNDNNLNYDESGNFSDELKFKASTLSKKKNTVALVEMDLETGEFTRKMFFDRSELGAIAVPKLFNVDYNTGELLVYAVKGCKEKFGIIRFGKEE